MRSPSITLSSWRRRQHLAAIFSAGMKTNTNSDWRKTAYSHTHATECSAWKLASVTSAADGAEVAHGDETMLGRMKKQWMPTAAPWAIRPKTSYGLAHPGLLVRGYVLLFV